MLMKVTKSLSMFNIILYLEISRNQKQIKTEFVKPGAVIVA